MISSEFILDKRPWEVALEALEDGATLPAASFLTWLEPEEEMVIEEALQCLEERRIGLDVSTLPPVSLNGPLALRLKQEAELSRENVTKGLEPNDPLRLFLEELARTPAAGDPQLLAKRYLQGEHHVAEQLVNVCMSDVIDLAMAHTGHGVLLLDLIQEGSLGLWQSILQYTGGEFMPYARWWIGQFMAKAVTLQARSSGIGQKLRQDMEDYLDADSRLLMELGRNPTVEEIAQTLHVRVQECENLEKMVASARSMEQISQARKEPEPTAEDEQAVEDTAYFQLRQRIMELLSTLSETDAKLLTLRFGLEGGKPLSPVQTGQILGLTAEQVVTREAKALEKLRAE